MDPCISFLHKSFAICLPFPVLSKGLKHVKGSSVSKGRNVSLPAVGKIRNDELKIPKRHLGGVLGKNV